MGINENTIFENCVLNQTNIKFKLVRIVDRRGYPILHFEIDGKMYFYGVRGIRADYKIALGCTKSYQNEKSKLTCCASPSFISPSEFLKEIIQASPKSAVYPKMFDKSDPRVYDLQNYDLHSFEIGKGHKCSGTDVESYLNFYNKPKIRPKVVECKLLKITNRLDNPTLHFEMKEKVYFYGIRGIKSDYRIELYCTKTHFDHKCKNIGSIFPSEFLKKIIRSTPKNVKPMFNRKKYKYYAKTLDISDPKVYDINNYDLNTFENSVCHNHPGTQLDDYYTNIFPFENENFGSSMETANNSSCEIGECIEKTEPNFSD
jgi:hypothetical protein